MFDSKKVIKKFVDEDGWEYCDECQGEGCAGCEGLGSWPKMTGRRDR